MTTTIAPFQDIAGWERTLYAFLAEKERRSGSRRTVEGYSRMLQHFFGTPARPSPDADAHPQPTGAGAREPGLLRATGRLRMVRIYRELTATLTATWAQVGAGWCTKTAGLSYNQIWWRRVRRCSAVYG